MRVLIYSDVHGNWEALTAVAAASAGQYEHSACLGDIVGYGADPNAVTAWVRAHTPAVIRGNHDRACAVRHGLEWFNAAAAAAAVWTHEQLETDHLQWLTDLASGPYGWRGMELVHGSPRDEDEYLTAPDQALEVLDAAQTPIVWFGHTHVQGGFGRNAAGAIAHLRTAEGDAPPTATCVRMSLEPEARYLLNPGSVGQPRDGDWRAAYAIVDEEEAVVEFHRVPYDLAAAQAKILDAGLADSLAIRLARGH